MATISENLQILKDSTDAIKQAIIDKGGTISGDITTWADAISGLSGGGELDLITFYIGGACSRICPIGMQWSEYIDSVFNTSDLYYGNIKHTQGVVHTSNGYNIVDGQTGDYITTEDIVISQKIYGITQGSGGGGN